MPTTYIHPVGQPGGQTETDRGRRLDRPLQSAGPAIRTVAGLAERPGPGRASPTGNCHPAL